MPNRSTVKSKRSNAPEIDRSVAWSGNVFADIGFQNADEMILKSDLVWYINREIERRGLTQTEAGKLLGINQPKVSALRKGDLTGFSVERLMRLLVSLGQVVDIRIRPANNAGIRIRKDVHR